MVSMADVAGRKGRNYWNKILGFNNKCGYIFKQAKNKRMTSSC